MLQSIRGDAVEPDVRPALGGPADGETHCTLRWRAGFCHHREGSIHVQPSNVADAIRAQVICLLLKAADSLLLAEDAAPIILECAEPRNTTGIQVREDVVVSKDVAADQRRVSRHFGCPWPSADKDEQISWQRLNCVTKFPASPKSHSTL